MSRQVTGAGQLSKGAGGQESQAALLARSPLGCLTPAESPLLGALGSFSVGGGGWTFNLSKGHSCSAYKENRGQFIQSHLAGRA